MKCYSILVCCLALLGNNLAGMESSGVKPVQESKSDQSSAVNQLVSVSKVNYNLGMFRNVPSDVIKYIFKLVIDQAATMEEALEQVESLKNTHPYFRRLIQEEQSKSDALSIVAKPRPLAIEKLHYHYPISLAFTGIKPLKQSLRLLQHIGIGDHNNVALLVDLQKPDLDKEGEAAQQDRWAIDSKDRSMRKANDLIMNKLVRLMIQQGCEFDDSQIAIVSGIFAWLMSNSFFKTAKTMLSHLSCEIIQKAFAQLANDDEKAAAASFLDRHHDCATCFPKEDSPRYACCSIL